MVREPLRGGYPDPSFAGLPGIDRARAYLRGAVVAAPLSHLTGVRLTQVGSGTATLTMPASPWLQALDGGISVQVLVQGALFMAALTGAPAGADVEMTSLQTNHFRPARVDSEAFLARARTLNSGRTFTFTEVFVEDALGRAVVQATAASVFRPADAWSGDPVGSTGPTVPVAAPVYATPDPYLRPLPAGVGIVPRQLWEEYDGPAIARMYVAGEVPVSPIAALFGIRIVDWDEGRIQAVLPATEWMGATRREVSAGVVALLAHLGVGGCTALKLEPPARRVGILTDAVSFYRTVPLDGRELMTRGRATHRPGDFIVSMAEVTDADGNLVAVAHRTSVLMEAARPEGTPFRRALLTVLFTDVVDSTRKVHELGDERWSELLGEHHQLIRRQVGIHHGREVKTTGDGFLVTFDSPTQAVQCARAVRDGVRHLGLELRAGVHTGECEVTGSDVTGLAVHVAARVQAAAAPGEILVSAMVRDLAAGSGLRLTDRGPHSLKGVDGEWVLYAVDD